MSALFHQGLPAPGACTECDLDLRIAQITEPLPPMPAEACTEVGAEPVIDPTDWAFSDFTLVVASLAMGIVGLANFLVAMAKGIQP
ncbi:hypothetical protein CDN99_06500 [Roseateles aquatilis]|uniref:Uncharacterized protein n=1 Tax=Roseateles aquatilis TaxID=431061 RepID=A0A246JHA5_9BURK|nr:hypothetical protein [Roseateles aquatilis]OWQ92004.1 hypothetical protein CDN99_06500 [Roseateles aquatilis]